MTEPASAHSEDRSVDQPAYRIADARVDPARNLIEAHGRRVRLEPRAMAVLDALGRRAGEVVDRGALLDDVWGDAEASDEALTQVISRLRRALGDDARSQRVIETVPKRGYRLAARPEAIEPVSEIAPVLEEAPTATTSAGSRATRRPRPMLWLAAGGAGLVMAIAATLWFAGSRTVSEEEILIPPGSGGTPAPGSLTRSAQHTQGDTGEVILIRRRDHARASAAEAPAPRGDSDEAGRPAGPG